MIDLKLVSSRGDEGCSIRLLRHHMRVVCCDCPNLGGQVLCSFNFASSPRGRNVILHLARFRLTQHLNLSKSGGNLRPVRGHLEHLPSHCFARPENNLLLDIHPYGSRWRGARKRLRMIAEVLASWGPQHQVATLKQLVLQCASRPGQARRRLYPDYLRLHRIGL